MTAMNEWAKNERASERVFGDRQCCDIRSNYKPVPFPVRTPVFVRTRTSKPVKLFIIEFKTACSSGWAGTGRFLRLRKEKKNQIIDGEQKTRVVRLGFLFVRVCEFRKIVPAD